MNMQHSIRLSKQGGLKVLAARSPRARSQPARRGFSLIELTLVLAIMGVLIAVASFNMLGQGDKAKARATNATMATIRTAIDQYNLDNSAFPPDLATLQTAKLLDASRNLVDGWNRPLVYDPRGRSKEQPYILGSNGSDGTAGTEDDISVWAAK